MAKNKKSEERTEIPNKITLHEFVKGSYLYKGVWSFFWNKNYVLYKSDVHNGEWALVTYAEADIMIHSPRNYDLTEKYKWYKTRNEVIDANQDYLMHLLYQGDHIKRIAQIEEMKEKRANDPHYATRAWRQVV